MTDSYTPVYNSDSGNSVYKVSNASNSNNEGTYRDYHYRKGGVGGSGSVTGIPVIVTANSGNRYQIKLDTPVRQTASENCS